MEKSIVEMAMYLVRIGYHPEDVAGYYDEEIEEAYRLETADNDTDDKN